MAVEGVRHWPEVPLHLAHNALAQLPLDVLEPTAVFSREVEPKPGRIELRAEEEPDAFRLGEASLANSC